MVTDITRRQLLGAGVSALGAGLVLAGCAGDSESASTSSPGTTGDVGDADTTSAAPAATTADSAPTTEVPVVATNEVPEPTGAPATTESPETSATSDTSTFTSGTPATTVFSAADFAGLGTCLVYPQLTAGPFPSVELMERRDITEGMAGHPLRVGIQLVDESCAPIPGALVEIWHCDVDGDYSAYSDGATDDDAGEGTTFYRGYQTSNTDGIVEFLTSYPGWYRGHAVHIHSTVRIDESTVLTTQFLFEDALNDEVMAQGVYAAYGSPDTTNDEDGVARGVADVGTLIMTASDDAEIAGTRALIVVGVDPNSRS